MSIFGSVLSPFLIISELEFGPWLESLQTTFPGRWSSCCSVFRKQKLCFGCNLVSDCTMGRLNFWFIMSLETSSCFVILQTLGGYYSNNVGNAFGFRWIFKKSKQMCPDNHPITICEQNVSFMKCICMNLRWLNTLHPPKKYSSSYKIVNIIDRFIQTVIFYSSR